MNLTLSKTSSSVESLRRYTDFPLSDFFRRTFSTPARSSHLRTEEPSEIFGKFLNSGSIILNDDHVVVSGNLTEITAQYSSLQARNGKKVNGTAPKSSGLPLYKFLTTHIFACMFVAGSRARNISISARIGFVKGIIKVEINS